MREPVTNQNQRRAGMFFLAPRDIPNIISILRLAAVVPILYLMMEDAFGWALLLFAVAGISDGIDGWLAKRYQWQTPLGGLLDPVADKVLLVCSFLVLGALDLLPIWLVAAAVLRDLIILGGALLYHYGIEAVEGQPLISSKLNTVVQILLVVAVITDAGPLPLPDLLIDLLIWACLLTVLASGIQYVWTWGRRAWDHGWGHD
jgi:cardiolipin synthase (CMP-forming)